MKLKEFRILSAKILSKNSSAEELILFESVIKQSNKLREDFEESKKIWDCSEINIVNKDSNIELDWARLESKLLLANTNSTKTTFSEYIFRAWKPVMATIALGFIVLTTLLITEQNQKYSDEKILVLTKNGEQKTITLPDGSNVTLNNASSIKYFKNFEDETREIKLRGEAFFIVKKEKRQFIVSTHNANTTVLGTEFNVNAREEETVVVVREGLVNLASKTLPNQNVNIPKEFSSLVTNENIAVSPEPVETKKILGWLDGKMFFEKTKLLEISKELERFYDEKVTLKSDNLNDMSVTGSFVKMSIDSTLTMICLTLNLKFEKNGNGYIIEKK
jgi:transmembrane sensor